MGGHLSPLLPTVIHSIRCFARAVHPHPTGHFVHTYRVFCPHTLEYEQMFGYHEPAS